MTFESLLTIVLGSSLVTVLVSKVWDLFIHAKNKKEEQYQKLYAPLKFYLIMIDVSDENKNQLIKGFRGTMIDWTKDKQGHNHANIVMKISDKQARATNPLIIKWWFYVDKIKELLENNPQYIKEGDFPIIRQFIDSHIKREIIGKNNPGDDTVVYLSEEQAKEYTDGILNIIIEMKEKFLN